MTDVFMNAKTDIYYIHEEIKSNKKNRFLCLEGFWLSSEPGVVIKSNANHRPEEQK